MMLIDDYQECYVWGTGLVAAKFFYENKDKLKILGFIDNNQAIQDTFCGLNIFQPDIELLKSRTIIVATKINSYRQIKKQLQTYGLIENKDFYWIDDADAPKSEIKKTCVVHGNCHVAGIKQYLLASNSFCSKYNIVETPLIFQGGLDEDIVKNCDIFIHQDIRKDNPYGEKQSDEYLLPKLKRDCISITVPNLFGLGGGYSHNMVDIIMKETVH